MAEKRKLLNEIDKCFKKIEEGVELFEETMSKMQEANSDNQREKFQDDLKKEIKKLQRLRDQIKGWQNSSDIKDKDRLTHYRKLIEQRMEQFKDIERENKTKPHSKQGLSAEEKLDPREKEKADTVEWLQCQIRFLEDESDKTESQIESISTTEQTRKKGKRDDPKKGEKEKLKKLEDLRKHLERMKFHASKLEICMRLVNNETLESKKVMETLKEQFELYIDALDPDSENDAESFDPEASGVYDELDLQSYTPQLGGAIFGANEMDEKVDNNGDSKSSSSVSPTPVLPKELEDNSTKQRHLSGEATVTLSRQISSTRSTPATPLKLTNQVSVEGSSLNSPPPPATPPPPPGIPYSVAAGLGTKSGKGAVIQTLVKQPVDVVRQPSGVISVTTTTTTTASVAQQSAAAQQQQSAPQQITANDNDSTTSTPLHIDMPPPLSSQPAALSPVIVPASGSSTPESNLVKRFSASSSTSSQQEVMPMKGVVMSSSSTQGGGAPVDVVPSSALSLTSSSAIVIQQQQQQQQQAVQSSPSAPQQQSPNTNPTTIPQPPSQPHTATLTPTSTPLLNQQQPSSLLSSHHTQLQQLSTQSSNTTSNAINSAINASSAASCNLANATTLPSANEIDSNALRQVLRIASSTHDARNQLPQSAVIPAWLGASPLGRAPITPEHDVQLNLLEHALTRTPLQMDSEKPRSYLPKMPCATASYYPQSPPANADTLEYYLRLSPETLFFTFYYMEGSRAQLLAAKALKKLSWRFHTKYLMWFQRHEEPKQITDDYEQGTYVYFDFEKWSQRKKEQFTFEYRYLEDKDFD